ncbi:MAG: hypothetical protein FIA91_08295 [Geobacter sp.]|nr:hypothetical protein [Geobacter sp.]
MPDAQLKKRLNLSAAMVLAAGGVAATAIYLTAATREENRLVSEFQNSKVYRRQLEGYGGKLSVVMDELGRWFTSLWQGENLAFTIAAISAVTALLLYWLARNIPPASKGDLRHDP